MWPITPPAHTAVSTFRQCISKIQDRDLRERLRENTDAVVAADHLYTAAAKTVTLHTLDEDDFTLKPTVTNKEMIAVYTDRMAKKNTPGRAVYDTLILAAPDERCPLCGHRQVSTLDHHLPKSRYPALAVSPNNLVPACSDCNKTKLNTAPASSEQETLHPYFDDIENDPWLKAQVLPTKPATLTFYVEAPPHWSPTLTQRVELHFRTFGLSRLYAAQAGQELTNIRYCLAELYAADPANGASLVRDHLETQARSRRNAHINSWQTSTYRALADSTWYCDGGFIN